jgi:Flp pilus assembly pilin Flp
VSTLEYGLLVAAVAMCVLFVTVAGPVIGELFVSECNRIDANHNCADN